jgi:hypothetical protein
MELGRLHRKRWPPSIGTRGRVQSVCLAAIVGIRNLISRYERVDFDGVVALDRDGVQFIIVHRHVCILRVLVPAPLVEALDRLARDLVHQLLAQPIAGFFVDLPERDALG